MERYLTTETLQCPTCGATQPWSNSCRRCKSELELVLTALMEIRRLHLACLTALSANDILLALKVARQRWKIKPDETSLRLLAICHAMLNQHDVVEHLLTFSTAKD